MSLKTAAFFLVLILATAPAKAGEFIKLGLDDTSNISPKIESDTKVKVEGKSSLRISTTWPTTVYLGEVIKPDIDGAKLIYSAMVKSELNGSAYLEMWAHVAGQQYFSRGMNDMSIGKSEWKTIHLFGLFDLFYPSQTERPPKYLIVKTDRMHLSNII